MPADAPGRLLQPDAVVASQPHKRNSPIKSLTRLISPGYSHAPHLSVPAGGCETEGLSLPDVGSRAPSAEDRATPLGATLVPLRETGTAISMRTTSVNGFGRSLGLALT